MKLFDIADTQKILKEPVAYIVYKIWVCESSMRAQNRRIRCVINQYQSISKFIESDFELLPYSPYSSDLALIDFFLLPLFFFTTFCLMTELLCIILTQVFSFNFVETSSIDIYAI